LLSPHPLCDEVGAQTFLFLLFYLNYEKKKDVPQTERYITDSSLFTEWQR